MNTQQPIDLETDPRFPSGPWTGFFLQKLVPGRHLMELRLTFRNGTMTGEGRDWVGPFVIRGRYEIADGRCHWNKRYLGKHDVYYKGFNEGKGIWGTWEIPPLWRGGFHIWPEGMPDPTQPALSAVEKLPMPTLVEEFQEIEEVEEVPAGTRALSGGGGTHHPRLRTLRSVFRMRLSGNCLPNLARIALQNWTASVG